jgi:protein-tyrosine phosphatase
VIDLHTHILPGVDDGARDGDESLAIAAAAMGDGIAAVAATPHVREDYPTPVETMERGVGELRRALARGGVPFEVLPGGEIALDYLPRLSREELQRFGLGGNPAYVLVEFPYSGWPLALDHVLFGLRADGFTPVLAHPERNADVQEAPDRLAGVVAAGALVQLTASSLDGRLGRRARAAAARLLQLGLAHMVSSDTHAPGVREIGLSRAWRSVADEALARWLMQDVPAAIVAGEPLPLRPAPRRRWFG